MLALFDLDGFKPYNDTLRPPRRRRAARRASARASRATVAPRRAPTGMGGDEFCVLVADRPSADELVARAPPRALDESGEGFTIGCSYGVGRAARRGARAVARRCASPTSGMYAHKRGGRPVGRRSQTHGRAAARRSPSATRDLGDHVDDVAELAEAVGARARPRRARSSTDVRRAAELHDIGKIAIPDAILDKPGPLDDDEWEFMRRHTLIGERILGAAPGARAASPSSSARATSAGTARGYPDGLAGEEIPLGARIIAVCDAYDAMVTDRPYRAARSARRGARRAARAAPARSSTRAVVDAFTAVLARSPEIATVR